MLSFLKVFARGIIVTLLLPIIVLVLAFYMVYCLILFVVMFFKGVIGFFKGNNINADLPEDLEARRIILENEKSDAQAKDALNMLYQGMAQGMAQAAFNQAQQQQQPQVRPDIIDYLSAPETPEEPKEIPTIENNEEGGEAE